MVGQTERKKGKVFHHSHTTLCQIVIRINIPKNQVNMTVQNRHTNFMVMIVELPRFVICT